MQISKYDNLDLKSFKDFNPKNLYKYRLAHFNHYLSLKKQNHVSKKACKAAIISLGINLQDSFYNLISEEDVVEVYSVSSFGAFPEFSQLWCNDTMVNACNYSFEQLIKNPFYELFERETWVNELISSRLKGIYDNEIVMLTDSAVHICTETKTKEQQSFKMQLKAFAPARYMHNPNIIGFASLLKLV